MFLTATTIKDFLLSFSGREWDFAPFLFTALLLRYVLFAGGTYLIFWVLFPNVFNSRRIQPRPVPKKQILEELGWSALSLVVNTLTGVFVMQFYFSGSTRIYLDVSEFGGWIYVPMSLVIYFVVHDAYFYWMHRAIHTPYLYKHIHHIHHKPTNPTPFATFCFHPAEAFLEMAFLFPLIFFVPIHYSVLLIFLLFTFLFNVNGHMGYEILPHGTWRKWWGRWLTTSTHHNMHHQFFRSNYALYIRFWDSAFGTLHPKTQDVFEAITSGKERPIR